MPLLLRWLLWIWVLFCCFHFGSGSSFILFVEYTHQSFDAVPSFPVYIGQTTQIQRTQSVFITIDFSFVSILSTSSSSSFPKQKISSKFIQIFYILQVQINFQIFFTFSPKREQSILFLSLCVYVFVYTMVFGCFGVAAFISAFKWEHERKFRGMCCILQLLILFSIWLSGVFFSSLSASTKYFCFFFWVTTQIGFFHKMIHIKPDFSTKRFKISF